MFGVLQHKLVKALGNLQASHCCYTVPGGEKSDRCDCKFGADERLNGIEGGENGNGCPELGQAMLMIKALTHPQFDRLAKRAGVMIVSCKVEKVK